MKKEYMVITYESEDLIKTEDEYFERLLNEEYGNEGYTLCSVIPINMANKVFYKFIFVKDKDSED